VCQRSGGGDVLQNLVQSTFWFDLDSWVNYLYTFDSIYIRVVITSEGGDRWGLGKSP
jgi:hypothetical protein